MILIALAALFVAALLYREHCRAREAREREDAWRLERVALLDRIQAPEKVVAQIAAEPSDEPLYVPADDDDAFADYVERRKAGEVN